MKPFSSKPARAKAVDREGLEQAALMKEIALRYLAIVCSGHFDAIEAIRAYLLQPQTKAVV